MVRGGSCLEEVRLRFVGVTEVYLGCLPDVPAEISLGLPYHSRLHGYHVTIDYSSWAE